jgi:hypothetical protein
MLSKQCMSHKLECNQQDIVCIPINEETSDTLVISMDEYDSTQCPHQDCPYATIKRDRMRKHFCTRHPDDIIIIQEEGILPQFTNCGIFQKNALSEQHTPSLECIHHYLCKIKRRNAILQQAATNVKLKVGKETIRRTSSFKYLGQIITSNDDDLPAVDTQIKKARQIWARIIRSSRKRPIPTLGLCLNFTKC